MPLQNWEIFVSVAFYFGAKILCYTYKVVFTFKMYRQDVLTSIPERSEIEEPQLKWVPKKKHEVLKAKYKCLKKLFQIYDASVIGALPAPTSEHPDDTTKRRRKRSHRTKTDACACTELINSGDVTQTEYDEASVATTRELKLKQSCSTQIDIKYENTCQCTHSNASKSDITSNSETNTETEDKCDECLREKHFSQYPTLPPHVVYLMNDKRKLTRFQCFVQRLFGIRRECILPSAYAASDCMQDGQKRRGLRFRRLRRAKKIKSENDIKDLKGPAILSYVQSVQNACLTNTTPRKCPMTGCKMITYGIINYNDHLNLCHFKDRKYICHYCHEGFEKELNKLIHVNEHIGISKINVSNMAASKLASNNTQTDPDVVIPSEKLKKIVSFFDKITNPDDIITEVVAKRSSESNLKGTDGTETNSSEKRTGSCINIQKCNCETDTRSSLTSQQYGQAVNCHVGQNLQYRRQLSLHEDLEKRNRDRFAKFHSCDSIINRARNRVDPRFTNQEPCESRHSRVNSMITDSITETDYSTDARSDCKLSRGNSSVSLKCDPSTNIVYYTSVDSVKPRLSSVVRKVQNYRWEPGTKVIHV